ncbi:nineteen complex-related protein 2-domain-containing protein [Thelonectria olida]|uniref:Nineteen complex-related protein 2-domain-containing protein n=1 Tax=Thelonectria olida TaxID=1576542 RepID=A0A9P9AWF9_9HYPO|nr:nineteen complex-related protein 2-domain-containing protein [Thelonectria olida]
MSSFGSKRKAKVIKVADENDPAEQAPDTSSSDTQKDEPSKLSFGSKTGKKPFRQSGLRKSFNPDDGDSFSDATSKNKEEEDDGPAVVRPAVSRSSSLKQKKRPKKSSRLSFGGDDAADGDGEPFTPKKAPLGQRVLENSAAKASMSTRGLPLRSLGDDDDRPKYSKEYLEELQSSTPNTPQNISTIRPDELDAMDLDESELEGALIVDSPDLGRSKPSTVILTDAEIREKKERRSRLAKEQDFLSVEDDTDSFDRKKKDDTRLVADDEELGEGFDNYVEDGGLSLGKRAEKERRKRDRQQMAQLISAAEGHTSESSSDSDAERRIAYEAAQTRAGMDGLKKPRKDPKQDLLQVPPKISPLPSLTECLAQLQTTLKGMAEELKGKQAHVVRLNKEREDIVKREAEVQALLDQTGRKYQEAMRSTKLGDPAALSSTPAELSGARGLETLGTPSRKPEDDEDVS